MRTERQQIHESSLSCCRVSSEVSENWPRLKASAKILAKKSVTAAVGFHGEDLPSGSSSASVYSSP
ncbi:hypothetical protein FOPG_19887 [Fusarium oxysporum f. sp. conglutinans race 2 54008]|uniref:Uncharacterized protein n=1 Tax=Fusarium oxysporum f. sp. conglutinans race 2 54008 TaxID=1089457 RepID=X0GVL1_FUSOX|nr:hypothetical protein FOPG_19887 [Fusarium oxysporum f. sp. conglutinans race 2 54008]